MRIKYFSTAMFFLKNPYPGGIWTRVFSFLGRMRCPLLRHAARQGRKWNRRFLKLFINIVFCRPVFLDQQR
jgi:hypothetical protein